MLLSLERQIAVGGKSEIYLSGLCSLRAQTPEDVLTAGQELPGQD
jgi:hypothetical protein